jgi:hypothetical protein
MRERGRGHRPLGWMVSAEDLHGRITAPVRLFFHEFGHHAFVVRLCDAQLVA